MYLFFLGGQSLYVVLEGSLMSVGEWFFEQSSTVLLLMYIVLVLCLCIAGATRQLLYRFDDVSLLLSTDEVIP